MSNKVKNSVYQKIALDIASRIVEHKFEIGEKIYARSSIANRYNVSPETARRAINVLADLEIVDIVKGSGVIIKSYENAVKFILNFSEKQTVKTIVAELYTSLDNQKNQIDFIKSKFDLLLENTQRFQSINPFVPFGIKVTEGLNCLGKTVSDINFWQNTNATIIAIKRGDSIILSPGPYAEFKENDIIYFVGDESSYNRVKDFLYYVE